MPVKVIVVGLFPTFYSMVATCCTYDYLSQLTDEKIKQISEYPDWMMDNYNLLVRIVRDLSKLGDFIRLEVVSLDSFKGCSWPLSIS